MSESQNGMSRTSLLLRVKRDMEQQFQAYVRQVREELEACQSLSAYGDIIVKIIKTDAAFNAQASVVFVELVNEDQKLTNEELEKANRWLDSSLECRYFNTWYTNAMSELKYDTELKIRLGQVEKSLRSDRVIAVITSIPGVLEPVSKNA